PGSRMQRDRHAVQQTKVAGLVHDPLCLLRESARSNGLRPHAGPTGISDERYDRIRMKIVALYVALEPGTRPTVPYEISVERFMGERKEGHGKIVDAEMPVYFFDCADKLGLVGASLTRGEEFQQDVREQIIHGSIPMHHMAFWNSCILRACTPRLYCHK